MHILPAHAFESTTIPTDHPFATRAFGSLGMRGELHADRATFAHPGGPPPRIPQFEIRPEATLEDLTSGRVHGLVQARPEDIPAIVASDDIALKSYDTQDIWFVAVNRKGKLADLDVRTALDAAIDRQALITAVWGDREHHRPDVLTGPFRQSSPFYNRAIRPREHDPGPLRLRRLRLGVSRAHEPLVPGLAEALAAQLEDRGVQVELVWLDEDPSRPQRDAAALKELDLLLLRWIANSPNHVRPIFEPAGTHNPFDVANPRIDRHLAEMEAARTDTAYHDASYLLHQEAYDDVFALWLSGGVQFSVWSNEVRNNVIGPRNYWTAFGGWRIDTP